MKKREILKWIILAAILCAVWSLNAFAAPGRTIYNNPNVTFSPDGKAWTTDAGKKNCVWYPQGTTVNTGISSSLPGLGRGEHYYRRERAGSVPVGRWIVAHTYSQCVHDDYPHEETLHGVSFGRQKCGRAYYSGWFAYCADCGDVISTAHIYMSESTAQSIAYLEMQDDLIYYYLCPYCSNLEQGRGMGVHLCKAVSANQYKVIYDVNADSNYRGYMPDSFHLYDNASEYEGEPVTPVTHLTMNSYTLQGYLFAGWNTRPDGSGESYEDGAEILNLSAADWRDSDTWAGSDKGVVTLYAQWIPSRSALLVNPNGGLFRGKSEITVLEGNYGDVITVDNGDVTAPGGHTVSFDVNGGTSVDDITGTMHFFGWSMSVPFHGRFSDGEYCYGPLDGGEDMLTACYEPDPISLPETKKEGYSFGGWYYDSGFSLPAGGVGDCIVPSANLRLYAQWVELVLLSEDNYEANQGKGAVDLSWTQSDNTNKSYILYQSTDGVVWERINTADDISNESGVDITWQYSGAPVEYTVPYTGIYTLTAEGAQGGNYGSFKGGMGGSVTGRFWLRQGEVITCTVGGSSGYNGGGNSTAYGNGGGYTIFSSSQKGVLMIAGGGGGASLIGDGGEGGSVTSLVNGSEGERGMAGGGGGAAGGSAGLAILHYHTGNSARYGGCYTITRQCQGKSFTTNKEVTGIYYGTDYIGSDGQWHRDGYCVQCGSYICPGHLIERYTYTCNTCKTVYQNSRPSSCTKLSGYSAGCGYTDGQVISSYPAYGGSNYVNTEFAYSYEKLSGVREGNGFGAIRSVQVGFVEELWLKGVAATDLAAPDMVSSDVKTEPIGTNSIKLIWTPPRDNGTEYYHVAESYLTGSEMPLCRSNITVNTLVSGLAGYYYLFDDTPLTAVNTDNGQYTAEPVGMGEFSSLQEAQTKYLHVAAVDVAGNLSDTVHIPVESSAVAWNLHTRKLEVENGGNVYPAQKDVWYVRSDGKTPFTLKYEAYLEGMVSSDYQLNDVVFENQCDGEISQNVIHVPSGDVSDRDIILRAEDLTFAQQGKPLLHFYPYSVLTRSDGGKELAAVQQFVLDTALSGAKFYVVPVAGADLRGAKVYSNHEDDEKNGIWLIADGVGPVINGLSPLENRELIDRRDGSLTLTVTATDELSGVRDLYVSVVNTDNAVEKRYSPDAAGVIRIEITADEPVFGGDFAVTAFAADNVGNVTEITYGITEFSLETHVERILEPHDPIFRNGESGILSVSVWGYADRVEVEFPREMTEQNPELDKVFEYGDFPKYLQEEKIQFMIPLYTPANESYEIIVRAYKGDRKLEEHPDIGIVTVDETVLDQFRTRLR